MSLDPLERAWLDARWAWLLETFGQEVPRAATAVVPDEACFPDPYDATPDAAGAMFTRVQGYMGLAEVPVVLGFMQTEDPWFGHEHMAGGLTSGAAGLFTRYGGKPRVTIATSKLDDPMSLAATMAHELGHVQLIGLERITGEEPDQEPLTDLITVFLGLGVLNANAVVRDRSWETVGGSAWQISRLGYMSQEEFAYALSLFARHRGESDPAWAKHLTADVRVPFLRHMKESRLLEQEAPSLDELSRWRGERMQEGLAEEPEDSAPEERGGSSLGWMLLAAVVLLGLCLIPAMQSPTIRVHLVNGTPYPATVTIDGSDHLVPPYERKAVDVKPGERTVVVQHPWEETSHTWELAPTDAKVALLVNVAGAAPLLIDEREYARTAAEAARDPLDQVRLEYGRTFVRLTDVQYVFEPWPETIRVQADHVGNPVRRRLTVQLAPPEEILNEGTLVHVLAEARGWLDHLERKNPDLSEHLRQLKTQLPKPVPLPPSPQVR